MTAYLDPVIAQSMLPDGIQISGRYWSEGPILIGLVHVQTHDEPITIRESVDLREVARALRRRPHIVGFFGSFVKAVKRVGRNKLLRKIKNTAKKVIKSKATGVVLAGVATVFPAAGVPALAAYAAANQALKLAEQGGQAANKVKALLKGTAARARAGDPRAQKQAQVFALVMRQRARARRRARALAMSPAGMQAGPTPRTMQMLAARGYPVPRRLLPARVTPQLGSARRGLRFSRGQRWS